MLNGTVGREDGPEKIPARFDNLGIVSGLGEWFTMIVVQLNYTMLRHGVHEMGGDTCGPFF